MQITIEDGGPKIHSVGTADSMGHKQFRISGTYMLSNLLQELTLAKDYGRQKILLDESRLNENPVNRLSRLIRTFFWDRLTRRMDAGGLEVICRDPKNRSGNESLILYIPHEADDVYDYYNELAKERPNLQIEIKRLPKIITPEWVMSINDKPGILALDIQKSVDADGKLRIEPRPFVVPGGRFNEMYGWDSYFEALGLIIDKKVDIAEAMVWHFIFQIKWYGKILNANRSYYLCRSQPPFLTDMALRVYEVIERDQPRAKLFLREAVIAAIKEYRTVWMAEPRYDTKTGLSRYRPEGCGIPPETEASHFLHVLTPYAEKHNMTFKEFQEAYNSGKVKEPVLDEYFLHDRAVRESGHDTTYRFEGKCANLATVDLNSLLYKYEVDIADIIKRVFNDRLVIPNQRDPETSASWTRAARKRKVLFDRYLWNEELGMYMDYDTVKNEMQSYESATTFWALWAGVASPKQAAAMVEKALPKFLQFGGLSAGTQISNGSLEIDSPNRQWDYPYGWAPQQIMAWKGLDRYGYREEVEKIVYRWIFMMTKSFVDYNGVVVEKYNVTNPSDPHRVDAEYGNQGIKFRGVAREGFGWVNASYQIGLTYLTSHARRALGACTPPEVWEQSQHADLLKLQNEGVDLS